jgi:transposase InsO family protein
MAQFGVRQFAVSTFAAVDNGKPKIFTTDQGSLFTSAEFTGKLEAGMAISMDGRGRLMDNIFIELLWRSSKNEMSAVRACETVLGFVGREDSWIIVAIQEWRWAGKPTPQIVLRATRKGFGASFWKSKQRNARQHCEVHAARTAFQSSGAVLRLMRRNADCCCQ